MTSSNVRSLKSLWDWDCSFLKLYSENMTVRSLCIAQHHANSLRSNLDTLVTYQYHRLSIWKHVGRISEYLHRQKQKHCGRPLQPLTSTILTLTKLQSHVTTRNKNRHVITEILSHTSVVFTSIIAFVLAEILVREPRNLHDFSM